MPGALCDSLSLEADSRGLFSARYMPLLMRDPVSRGEPSECTDDRGLILPNMLKRGERAMVPLPDSRGDRDPLSCESRGERGRLPDSRGERGRLPDSRGERGGDRPTPLDDRSGRLLTRVDGIGTPPDDEDRPLPPPAQSRKASSHFFDSS